jgi:hypothetical protein
LIEVPNVISEGEEYALEPGWSLEPIFLVNLFFLRDESTESHGRVISWDEPHYGDLVISDHLFDESISDLARASDSFLIWVDEVGMLDVVVHLQGLSRLEPHELHANSVEILDLLHIFGGDADLLSTYGIEGADLIFVKLLKNLQYYHQKIIYYSFFFRSNNNILI